MSTPRAKPSKPAPSKPAPPQRRFTGAEVQLAEIRRFARKVAQRFKPDKIVLFGSHAYGTPHADSDVDILVIMPARNQHDQAFKIRLAVSAPFPMDLIVRTPANLKWRLAEGESFSTDIVTKGKVLYEKINSRVGAQGRRRSSSGGRPRPKNRPSS